MEGLLSMEDQDQAKRLFGLYLKWLTGFISDLSMIDIRKMLSSHSGAMVPFSAMRNLLRTQPLDGRYPGEMHPQLLPTAATRCNLLLKLLN